MVRSRWGRNMLKTNGNPFCTDKIGISSWRKRCLPDRNVWAWQFCIRTEQENTLRTNHHFPILNIWHLLILCLLEGDRFLRVGLISWTNYGWCIMGAHVSTAAYKYMLVEVMRGSGEKRGRNRYLSMPLFPSPSYQAKLYQYLTVYQYLT